MRANNAAAHLCMLLACIFWGLMSPLGKDAMTHGITGMDMVTFRVIGGAVLFWITSLFMPWEHVPKRDMLMFAGAATFGLITNQCCFTVGLSITSPINASIVTISMPIFAMLLAALILREPITAKKAIGVAMGCVGATTLILTSATAGDDRVGDIRGDLLCVAAQLSFALYLSLFSGLVKKYSVFTVNKWMFTYGAVLIVPFTIGHLGSVDLATVPTRTWLETGFVVFFGTYVSYILMMVGQHNLRPTVVSSYNYVQPAVAVTVSVLTGMGILKPTHGIAMALIILGIWLITKSRARAN